MKIVFNFKIAAGLLLGALLLAAAPAARAEEVYWRPRDILADFFRSSSNVTFKKVIIGEAERARIVKRLGYTPARGTYNFYVATSQDRVDGYALIDEEMGEHMPITFAVKLSQKGVVERQEVMVYREPRGDEVRDEGFRKQFVGKTANDPLSINDDIVAISGATISSRSMSVGVKRALVLFDELVRTGGKLITASAK